MASSTLQLVHRPGTNYVAQVLATIAVSLGPLAVGMGKGYSSPALASMTVGEPGGGLNITMEQGSWIASSSLLGALVGGVPGGLAMRLGRRRVLMAVCLPFSAAWWMTASASAASTLYAAAFFSGACSAVVALVTPVYISEVAQPQVRGALFSICKVASSCGMLASFVLGRFLDWRQLAMTASVAPMLLFFACIFIPETPSYLLCRGRHVEAAKSLQWLRSSGTEAASEHEAMLSNIQQIHIVSNGVGDGEESPSTSWRSSIKPLLITCGLMLLQRFSGAHAFHYYAVPILSKNMALTDAHIAAIVVVVLQILAGLTSGVLIDTVGRIPLLVASTSLMSVALAGFGTIAYLYQYAPEAAPSLLGLADASSSYDLLLVSCMLVVQVGFALGLGPISSLLIGELFPVKQRGLGAVTLSVSYASAFVSVKTHVDLERWLGLYGVFWLYAVVSAVCLLFALIFVPETKGKDLSELRDFSAGKPSAHV